MDVFAEAGCTVHGCDLSARLIAHGRGRGVSHLYCGDLDELARHLDGQRAELVLLHHVFEHLGSPLKGLEAAKGVLADGGMIVVAVPDVSHIEGLPSPNGDLRLMLHLAHKYNYSLKGLRRLGARAGLQARLHDVEPSRDAPELWIGFARTETGIGPPAEQSSTLSAAQFDARLRDVERRYVGAAVRRRLERWWRSFSS